MKHYNFNNAYRSHHALNPGDTIQCADNTEYTVDGSPIGFGGSSIVYAVTKKNSSIKFVLKECFPYNNCDHFERINGIIQPIDPNNSEALSQLEYFKENIKKEATISQQLFNTNYRTIPTWDVLSPSSITTGGKTYYNVSDGLFSIQPRFDLKASSLDNILESINNRTSPKDYRRTRGLPNVHLTACIMEEILTGLHQVHSATTPFDSQNTGFYYGDLHPGNIFFAEVDLERGRVGTAFFLDYGSSMMVDKTGKTSVLQMRNIYSTDGYWPPEASKDGVRLSQSADIYSAGCLLLSCVVSKAKRATYGRSPIAGTAALDEVDAKAIGCNKKSMQLINKILCLSTKENPSERYANAEAMLCDIRALKLQTEPPRFLLSPNLSAPDYPVYHSRDRELATVIESINAGEDVFLHGVGGIGKTEVAIELAKRISPPKGAYLIRYQNSMRETILSLDFSGYSPKLNTAEPAGRETEETEYQERMQILKEQYQDALIIIDNFDVPGKSLNDLRQEPAYREFIEISGINKIFTTRYPFERKEWEIRRLPDSALKEIMRHYCKDESITDFQLQELIDAVDGHTLMCILIAKTMEESWRRLTPRRILKAIKRNSLDQSDFPEIVNDQNRKYQQARIYTHLKTLFNLTNASEKEKMVLSRLSMLPIDGIDALVFEKSLKKRERQSLHNLVKQGWVTRTNESKLVLHPVIREVCKTELDPVGRTYYSVMLRWLLPLSAMGMGLQGFLRLGLEDSITTRICGAGILVLCFAIGILFETWIEKLAESGHRLIAKILTFCIPAITAFGFAEMYFPNSERSLWPAGVALTLWIVACCVDHVKGTRKQIN